MFASDGRNLPDFELIDCELITRIESLCELVHTFARLADTVPTIICARPASIFFVERPPVCRQLRQIPTEVRSPLSVTLYSVLYSVCVTIDRELSLMSEVEQECLFVAMPLTVAAPLNIGISADPMLILLNLEERDCGPNTVT